MNPLVPWQAAEAVDATGGGSSDFDVRAAETQRCAPGELGDRDTRRTVDAADLVEKGASVLKVLDLAAR